MNRIEFRVERAELGIGDADVMSLYVDEVLLQDLIRPLEQPFADAEGNSDLAGQYVGLANPIGLGWPSRHYLGEPKATWFGDGDTILLGCNCGDAGCWPLIARVELDEQHVTWRGFRTGHRDWDLSSFGPFAFDRQLYERSLRAATA